MKSTLKPSIVTARKGKEKNMARTNSTVPYPTTAARNAYSTADKAAREAHDIAMKNIVMETPGSNAAIARYTQHTVVVDRCVVHSNKLKGKADLAKAKYLRAKLRTDLAQSQAEAAHAQAYPETSKHAK